VKKTTSLVVAQVLPVTAAILLLNGWAASNMVSDRAGVAMESGLFVIVSFLICIAFVAVWFGKIRRERAKPVGGCVSLIIWLIAMLAVLSVIWTKLARFQ